MHVIYIVVGLVQKAGDELLMIFQKIGLGRENLHFHGGFTGAKGKF